MSTTSNPYQAPPSGEPSATIHWLPRILLVVVSLVLLVRGLMMAFAYAQLGLQPGSFFLAIFLKDGIYGLTALLGSTLLLFRSRPGWCFAVAHWFWYLAYEVVVAGCASLLNWSFPLSFGWTSVISTSILATFALLILFSRPVLSLCGVNVSRMKVFIIMLPLAIIAAFLINGLALSRWW